MWLSKRLRITPRTSAALHLLERRLDLALAGRTLADDEHVGVGELREVHRLARGQHGREVEQQVVELAPRSSSSTVASALLPASAGRRATAASPAAIRLSRGFAVGWMMSSSGTPCSTASARPGGARRRRRRAASAGAS